MTREDATNALRFFQRVTQPLMSPQERPMFDQLQAALAQIARGTKVVVDAEQDEGEE